MKSGSNTLLLIGAILALLPLIAVNFIIDSYVRRSGISELQRAVTEISAGNQAAIYEGIDVVKKSVAGAPSLCTPTFLENVHELVLASNYVRQIAVHSKDGVLYCDAFDSEFSYVRRSVDLNLPGRDETLSVVKAGSGDGALFFKITYAATTTNMVSAFVQFPHAILHRIAHGRTDSAYQLRLLLSDGTELTNVGPGPASGSEQSGSSILVANAYAGDLPVRAEATAEFSAFQGRSLDLYFLATIGSCLISGSLLLLVLQVVRRGKVPDFDLERAIVNREIKPYYQPVIDIVSGKVVGAEMLARWVKPNGKVISPAAFIDYAEVTGLAIPMTLRLMEQVRDDLADLSRKFPQLKVSINLFEGHFRDGNIIEDVQAIFGGSSISYRQLVFEITERHPLDDEGKAQAVISGLRALGAKMALDDLGTGHSNLAYLQKLGLDIVKIDRMFVEMVDESKLSVPVLEGLIKIGQDLGAEMVAEGVETREQAEFLRDRGVRQVQGFMFSPALSAEKYIRMVETMNALEQQRAQGTNTSEQAAA